MQNYDDVTNDSILSFVLYSILYFIEMSIIPAVRNRIFKRSKSSASFSFVLCALLPCVMDPYVYVMLPRPAYQGNYR